MPSPSQSDHEALVKALEQCVARLKMEFDEVKHLLTKVDEEYAAERSEQDEASNDETERVIEIAEALLSTIKAEGKP